MNDNNPISEEGMNTKIAIEHRLGVMKAGKIIWYLIIALSIWGIYSQQYQLIIIAFISGWGAMWYLSIHAANKVEKLTGLTHSTQAALWKYYKQNLE